MSKVLGRGAVRTYRFFFLEGSTVLTDNPEANCSTPGGPHRLSKVCRALFVSVGKAGTGGAKFREDRASEPVLVDLVVEARFRNLERLGDETLVSAAIPKRATDELSFDELRRFAEGEPRKLIDPVAAHGDSRVLAVEEGSREVGAADAVAVGEGAEAANLVL